MSKGYFAAFAVISGLAVLGVDYVNQARRAGAEVASFGAAAYLGSIGQRYGIYRADLEQQDLRRSLLAQERRELLPQPPDGWTRHGWGDADEAFFGTDQEVELPEALQNDKTIQGLMELDRRAARRKREEGTYVYEKGDNKIVLLAHYDRTAGQGSGISGPFMALVNNNIEAMSGKTGFAVVQGVTFRQDLGLFGAAGLDEATAGEEPSNTLRSFSANLNNQVIIKASARATDEAVFELLSAIDFDQLNQLLTEPIAGIGKAAPVIPWEEQKATADARVAEDSAAQVERAVDHNARLMKWAEEMTARHKGKTPTEAEYEAEEQATAGDGAAASGAETLWSMIASRFGGGSAAVEEPEPNADVSVGFGSDNCSMLGASKRCSTANN